MVPAEGLGSEQKLGLSVVCVRTGRRQSGQVGLVREHTGQQPTTGVCDLRPLCVGRINLSARHKILREDIPCTAPLGNTGK